MTRLPTGSAKGTLADFKQLRALFAYTRPYRLQFATGLLAVILASGVTLLIPVVLKRFFNGSGEAGAAAMGQLHLTQLLLTLLGLFLLQAVFNFLRTYMISQVGEGVVADLRRDLFAHLVKLPLRFFESERTGAITSRLTADAAVVQSAVSQSLAQLVNQLVLFLGSVVLLFVSNTRLTLLMLVVVPVVILAASFFGKRLRKVSTDFQDKVAEANASAEEAMSSMRVVKSFTGEGLEAHRYQTLIQGAYKIALKRALYRALFFSGIIFAMFMALSLVLWVGGRLVLGGNLTLADLLQFLLYTLIVAGAVGALTGLYSQFQEALGASKRIFELLDMPAEQQGVVTQAPPPVRGEVRFEHVNFSYGAGAGAEDKRGKQVVLQEINLVAKPGTITALVGPSGAGKSTLASLIPRFYEVREGRITLDGEDIRQRDLQELRQQIAIVPQETQLFSGTIADNIRYGKPAADEMAVIAAAQAANAHDFIATFPEGYQTVVGERGLKLSGGQRQRVAIARALLKDPHILILDEATSSLDTASEALVQGALDRLMQGRTVFVIAHRLSTIMAAQQILVLENGRIVEQGTHQGLLERSGLYATLYEGQFAGVATLTPL